MTSLQSHQRSIPVVIARGGTSKGLYFHESDLPAAGPQRDHVLARVMGSPDPIQIDGLGGSRPVTSKIAIIAPSERDDADVEYTFGQVLIDRERVDYFGNCGNISSGVGPFAVDEKLVPADEPVTRVRIHNTNTDRVIVADVPVVDGQAAVTGDFAIPGVPGTGAEIAMNWAATVGSKTGHLLPTGRPRDTITLTDGTEVPVSVVDAANPFVWVDAVGLGLDPVAMTRGLEDGSTNAVLRELRGRAAELTGFSSDWRDAEEQSPTYPILGVVGAPVDYTSLQGEAVVGDDMDLCITVMFMNQLHPSVPGTGSISLAAASRTPGTVVHAATRALDHPYLAIGHPSGVVPTPVRAHVVGEAPYVAFDELGFSRTARRIAEAVVYYPG